MQQALCVVDGVVYEASLFSSLPSSQLEDFRKYLLCSVCKSFAWFRKESRHGHPAHFCAHHEDSCVFKIEYVPTDNARGSPSQQEDGVTAGDKIVINLDKETGGDINVAAAPLSNNPGSGFAGRAYSGPKGGNESTQNFTLRRILHRLVQSPQFRDSPDLIEIYQTEGQILVSGAVREVFKSFEQINGGSYGDGGRFYWGAISSLGRTPDGRIWLNSGGRGLVSVSINSEIVDEFLEFFEVDELEELTGAHVLVNGRCVETGTGKLVIWCGSVKNIIIRKYKNA